MTIESLITNLFKRDHANYEGVPRINVYIMRLFFSLMFVFVGFDSWSAIVNHQGHWKSINAVAVCVWAAYSTLSILGVFHTLKMLPIMLFMIFYKTLWLLVVAFPLWINNQLAGSDAEEMANVFIWVIIPVVGMPWGYVFRTYVFRTGHWQEVPSTK
jgi:hypothetical protein